MAFTAGGGGGGAACGGGGVFSTFDPPTSRMRHICFFTICGHGEKLVVENTPELRQVVAEKNEQISSLWPHDLNLTVSSVIPMVSFAPGISQTLKNEIPTNFSSHLPGMTLVVRGMKASLEGASKDKLETPADLIPFGEKIMAEIRKIDGGVSLKYQEEKSSVPHLVSERDFYQTSWTSPDDYTARNNRVVWVRPNEGEGRRPGSNQPMRVVSDGDDVFPFYGVFVIMVIGGILPQTCTLTRMHEELILPHAMSHKYTKYNPEVVKRYNLVARENRVDVETKIARVFLSKISGILSPTHRDAAAAWDAYKSDPNGAIQILRRAIVYKHISQIEASILLHALGYTDLLLVDSACNCPGDHEPTEPFIDSQDADRPGITDAEARCWDSRADPAAAEAGARAGGGFDLQGRRMHASVRHGRHQHTDPLSDEYMAKIDSSAAAAADMGGRLGLPMGVPRGGGSKRKKSRKRLLSKNRKRQKCRRTRRKRYTIRRR